MVWYNWLGPSILVSSFAHLCYINHNTEKQRQWLSNTTYALILFGIYVTGIIPRNRFFPNAFFQANVFNLLYKVYCSNVIGYHCLRKILHQPSPYPHSDFRFGVRCLSQCAMPSRSFTVSSACNSNNTNNKNSSGKESTNAPLPTRSSIMEEITSSSSSRVSARTLTERECGKESNEGNFTDQVQLRQSSSKCQVVSHQPFWPLGLTDSERCIVDLSAMAGCAAVQMRRGVLVVPVPMFADNYSYLILSLATGKAVAVDAADPWSVLRLLKQIRTQLHIPFVLSDLLTTHKHWDHAGGNATLLEYASSKENHKYHERGLNLVDVELNVIGSEQDRPKCCTRLVNACSEESSIFTVADGAVVVRVFDAPGHTFGSVMYLVADTDTSSSVDNTPTSHCSKAQQMALFTGDSLFIGGCGALFELRTLAEVLQTQSCFLHNPALRQHPLTKQYISQDNILLYVGHEYTQKLLGEVYSGVVRNMSRNATVQVTHNNTNNNNNTNDDNNSNNNDISVHRTNAENVMSADCVQYVENVYKAYHEVKNLRAASDGLADVAALSSAKHSNDKSNIDNNANGLVKSGKKFRLPLCTVPSTLAMECLINPFLTVSVNALQCSVRADNSLDKAKLESIIFTSTDRHIHVE